MRGGLHFPRPWIEEIILTFRHKKKKKKRKNVAYLQAQLQAHISSNCKVPRMDKRRSLKLPTFRSLQDASNKNNLK
jgi:hypothetical protein